MFGAVMLVEDDSFLLLTMSQALRAEGLEVFTFATPAAALQWASVNPVASAILDLHLGDGPTGIDLAVELRRVHPKIALVFVTSFADPKLLDTALPKLPKGSVYLRKSELGSVADIIEALATASELKTMKQASQSPLSALTGSQIETLKLVALGCSNSEIAKKRFVTEKSVEQTIARAAKALGFNNDPAGNQRVNLAKSFFQETGLKVVE